MLKVAVLISGGGSNLQALMDICATSDIPAEIKMVLSNKADAYGLERAQNANIPTAHLSAKAFKTRAEFDAEITQTLERAGADFVCLAGYMRILSDEFVDHWQDRLINIHPSLLPSFKGLHVQQRAIDAGVKFSGCTVHFVRPAMDEGPIIAQAVVPVLAGDTADTLSARILEQEHKIYPLALNLIANGQVKVVDERTEIKGEQSPHDALTNPITY